MVQVALAREWLDLAPLDLAACLGWEEDRAGGEDLAGRVLVVRSRLGEVPVRAQGKVGLCDAQASSVLRLPGEVLHGHCAIALTDIVLEEGRKPVLVLAPEGLFQLFQLSS